jgi:ABC-type transport system substrate-binding protein
MRSIRALERALVAASAALLSQGLGACRGALDAPLPAAHPGEQTPRRGGTLRLATFGDVGTLDPAVSSNTLTSSVIRLLYAGLVDFDAEGRVVPDLAAQISEEDLGRTYRFTLHENARFHDGTEVTAADVKRSIERALHPTTPSPGASDYDAIEGYEEYAEKGAAHLEGVVVLGRYVVAIHLREPDATFLPKLALAALRITCTSAGDRYSPSFVPCGAGPFRLPPGGWERGASLSLVRHDGYFRPELPHLDGVTWELGGSVLSEGFKFARGSLDVIRDLSQADTVRYQSDPRWQPLGSYEPARDVHGDAMNTEIPPFDNVEVRRAVAAAVDRDHLVLLRASNFSPAEKPVPPGMPGYDPPPGTGQHHDLAAALGHMKAAGYPFDPATGRGGWPSPIVYDVYKQGGELAGQILQQDLAKIGLRIELRVSSFPTYTALTHRRGKSAMSPQGWTEDYPDPANFLEPLFASKSMSDEDTNNFAFYSNPTLDAVLARAHGEANSAVRTRLYAEAERIVCDDAPWAFEYAVRLYPVHQPYVRGYRTHALWMDDAVPVWLDRADAEQAARSRGPFARELLGSLIVGPR